MEDLSDQEFLETIENAEKKGQHLKDLIIEIKTTPYKFAQRRKRLNFEGWFFKRNKRGSKFVSYKYIDKLFKMTDQEFLKQSEEFVLQRKTARDHASFLGVSEDRIFARRDKLGFSKIILDKYGTSIKEITVPKKGISPPIIKVDNELDEKTIKFNNVLKSKMKDPKFLNQVYNKIAHKMEGKSA